MKNTRYIIGFQACREALSVHTQHIKQAWLQQNSQPRFKKIIEDLEAHQIKIQYVGERRLNRLGEAHQGIALECSWTPEWKGPCHAGNSPHRLCVALDGVVDPRNLGAILRSCWLVGVEVVLVPQRRAAPLSPTTHKVACGAAEHVPVEEVSNIKHSLRQLQNEGFALCALSHQTQQHVWDIQLPPKLVWIAGSEATGLRPSVQKMCDHVLSWPQQVHHASFNVSVALSMALIESQRQHLST